jgi:cellulose biosynthesis protein BcsQ
MRIEPRVGIITFFPGGKGGAGASTIASSFAVALSEYVNNHVLVVDFGYGANATTTKIFGKDPGAVGVYDFVFGKANPRPIKVDEYRVYLLTNGYRDPNQVVNELARVYATDPGRFTRELTGRLKSFLVTLAEQYGINHVIIDLPSATVGPHTFSVLSISTIINIIALHSSTHIGETLEAFKIAVDANDKAVINIIVNRVYPIGDSEAQYKSMTRRGHVFPISCSMYASYIIDWKRDVPIAWDFPGNWRRDLMKLVQAVKRQVDEALSRVKPSV